ncbi:Putative major facilitator superfamily protein [Tolypocladium paradoxum]|uniref:Major facilitator superfamily protein n=1 Tax=Tolypocladium paradoxum TaxID=94208 RepID=A0A2S4L5Q5_9HYPO|nr:Putative major facilitator superfamily protein [Tolypocladium paradoxum]
MYSSWPTGMYIHSIGLETLSICLLALAITSLLAAVESTVTSTALPVISDVLDMGELHMWFVNAYFVMSTAFLPLFGQAADVFGRRWLTIGIVASDTSGGATSTALLIAGRAIRGVGDGGINLMIEMIVCDLVPLRDRGRFMGVMFAFFAVGTSLGLFIGGAIVFSINLPISGVSLILFAAFLHVNYQRGPSTAKRHRRIDYTGIAILTSSTTAILIALTYGGTRYPWSAWQVLLPLMLGFAGLGGFYLFIIYFIPVFFQAVPVEGPTTSGVLLPPTVVTIVPGALISGLILSKFARYRSLHFAMMTVGIGLFILLKQDSGLALYVVFQIIGVFKDSLYLVWIVAVGVTKFSSFVVFPKREIKLRYYLETEYGLEGPKYCTTKGGCADGRQVDNPPHGLSSCSVHKDANNEEQRQI